MVGGVFSGSNDGVHYTTLHTIQSVPDGWMEVVLSDATPYRYLRYQSPNGSHGNIAEMEFFAAFSDPPTAPLGLRAIVGDQRVLLQWTAPSHTLFYRIQRASSADGPYAMLAEDWPEPQYTDDSLTNGTPYFYKVSALNNFGESEVASLSATPIAPTPIPKPTPPNIASGGKAPKATDSYLQIEDHNWQVEDPAEGHRADTGHTSLLPGGQERQVLESEWEEGVEDQNQVAHRDERHHDFLLGSSHRRDVEAKENRRDKIPSVNTSEVFYFPAHDGCVSVSQPSE